MNFESYCKKRMEVLYLVTITIQDLAAYIWCDSHKIKVLLRQTLSSIKLSSWKIHLYNQCFEEKTSSTFQEYFERYCCMVGQWEHEWTTCSCTKWRDHNHSRSPEQRGDAYSVSFLQSNGQSSPSSVSFERKKQRPILLQILPQCIRSCWLTRRFLQKISWCQ